MLERIASAHRTVRWTGGIAMVLLSSGAVCAAIRPAAPVAPSVPPHAVPAPPL
jgi:hypothetical protein